MQLTIKKYGVAWVTFGCGVKSTAKGQKGKMRPEERRTSGKMRARAGVNRKVTEMDAAKSVRALEIITFASTLPHTSASLAFLCICVSLGPSPPLPACPTPTSSQLIYSLILARISASLNKKYSYDHHE
jgi:hypothetical protein